MRRIDPSEFDTQLCKTPGCRNDLAYAETKDGEGLCSDCRKGETLIPRMRGDLFNRAAAQ